MQISFLAFALNSHTNTVLRKGKASNIRRFYGDASKTATVDNEAKLIDFMSTVNPRY